MNRKPKPPDSRRRILESALTEFAEYGIAGARVDRIAALAGVNKALLYYYYQSKEKLYRECLTTFLGEVVGAIRLRLDEARTIDDALIAVANHYRTVFLNSPEIPRLILRELANPKSTLIPLWAEQIQASGVPGIIRRYLQEGKTSGQLRDIDPRQTIVSFITMQIGYFLMFPLIDRVLEINDHDEFVRQRADTVVDIFLNGVKAR